MRLLCVGNGPVKPDLLTLQPDVLTFSPGGRSQVLPYYQVMDTLVLPSRTTRTWKEQFGRVLAEAMACGVLVIGSDSGAIPEVIGNAGIIFREGNVEELQSHLLNLMTMPELRRTLSQRGRQLACNKFSERQIAEKTVQAYCQVSHRKNSD